MNIISYKSLLALSLILGVLVTDFRSNGPQKPPLEPLRVGVSVDLSGRHSSFTKSTLKGVKLAAAEINAHQATEGRRVELIIEDDLGRADEAATVVQRLINQKRIHALSIQTICPNTKKPPLTLRSFWTESTAADAGQYRYVATSVKDDNYL